MGAVHRTVKGHRYAIWWNRWNGNSGEDSKRWKSLWHDQTIASKRGGNKKCSVRENEYNKILNNKCIADKMRLQIINLMFFK